MLGLVLSLLVAAVSPPASLPGGGVRALARTELAPSNDEQSDVSDDDSCEQAPVELCQRAEPSARWAGPTEALPFATPAVIDCRVPVAPGPLQALVGECDGTARDASYRASRDPDSEQAPGSLSPARRERSPRDQLSACAGLPGEGGSGISHLPPGQPIALFALPALPHFNAVPFSNGVTFVLPAGQLRLLERPPRA